MSVDRRRAKVEREHPTLPLSRQCALLSISRSSLYYTPRGESERNLALMRQDRRTVSEDAVEWIATDGACSTTIRRSAANGFGG